MAAQAQSVTSAWHDDARIQVSLQHATVCLSCVYRCRHRQAYEPAARQAWRHNLTLPSCLPRPVLVR